MRKPSSPRTVVEGIVIYNDRTPLERWVEDSYFGDEPKYKDWPAERQALLDALKKSAANVLADSGSSLPEKKESIEPDKPAPDSSAALFFP